MKFNWKLIFAGLLFLVLVSAVFVVYLISGNADKCDERCQNADDMVATSFDIETWVVGSETALSIQSTETIVAKTRTPSSAPSPTPSPTPSPIATP